MLLLSKLFRTKLQNIVQTKTNEDTIVAQFQYFYSKSIIQNITFSSDENATIDPIGEYAVYGTNPWDQDSHYFGGLSITKEDNKYVATWKIGFTSDGQSGKGFVSNGLLCIDFEYFDAGKKYGGKVIYKIFPEKLIGFWAEPNSQNTGYEECIRKS